MQKKTILFLLPVLVIFLNYQYSSGQSICVADDLKVSSVSGKVFLSNGTIINDLEIVLSTDILAEKIVKTVRTDKEGKFSFGGVKSGKYIITIKRENLVTLVFQVNVKKKYGRKNRVGVKVTMYVSTPGNCSIAETYLLDKA